MNLFASNWPVPRLMAVAAIVTVSAAIAQTGGNTVLAPADLQRLFPGVVYYDGQSAPAQLRNSGGVKFADGHFVLFSLVDTSGYSTGVAARYQGYLIAEIPLKIGEKQLPAGAYGFGFLDGARFLVTDLGGSDVFTVHSDLDASMKRPRPLEVMADPAGGFRLYSGRSYIRFDR